MDEYDETTTASVWPYNPATHHLDQDVLIIGAGMSGIHTLYKAKELGFRTKVLEAGADVGGTWFWNRYPGARFESESHSYGFSFSQELLDEWHWNEYFSPQPDTLEYLHYVVKKFDLRKDMQFNTKIVSMHFQDDTRSWLLTDQNDNNYTSRFVVTCMGLLNEPTLPNVPGVEDFKGLSCHTARWPDEQVDFSTKRVAVIGTGATGIQTISEVAKTALHLTVLQRTPNWSAPLYNHKVSVEEMAEIRKRYPQTFKDCNETTFNFLHTACSDTRKTMEVPSEEREAFWEELYATPGFAKWVSNYRDQGFDRKANALFSEFVANKIRQRVHDPVTAEKLIPKCHGFGTKRVPLETFYFECYNQPNVRLKDIKEDPIEPVTEKGIKTRDEELEFDMIIYATGFDGVTGSFANMDIRGIDGVSSMDQWKEGPQTFLGLFVENIPNMLMVMGPHQVFGNCPRSIEYASNWIIDFLNRARQRNVTRVEATREAVDAWTDHVYDCAKGMLANEVDSWMTGVNKNVEYKQRRIVARYNGPAPGYRRRAEEVKARGYSDLKLA